MRIGRLLAVAIVFCMSSVIAPAKSADFPFEEVVQYALENLISGQSTAVVINGEKVRVMPIRTWKSVSGHYCRRYEITTKRKWGIRNRSEWTRCRDDGIWKKVKEN